MDNNKLQETNQNVTPITNEAINTPSTELPRQNSEGEIRNPQQNDTTVQSQEVYPANNRISFNSEETIVYEMKPEKEANPIGVILFFIVIISFAFFLPDISKYIDNLKGTQAPSSNQNEKPSKEEQKDEDVVYYNLNETIKNAKIDNLEFSNFVKTNKNNNYELTFTIINSGEEIFTYDKKYYFEFYNDESYLSSSILHSYEPLAPKSATEFTIILPIKTYEKATKFSLVEKTVDDYPEVNLSNIEGEYKLLKCTYNNDKITYYFKDDYLETITNVYQELPSSTTFTDNLYYYRNLVSKYNTIEGIESILIETPADGFTVKTTLTLSNVQGTSLTNLKEYKYFLYHEKSKVVKYEMISNGYTCS